MRRAVALVLGVGVGLIVVAVPLGHVTRWTGCESPITFPCDPVPFSPYGNLAAGLTLVGVLAILVALVLGLRMIILRARLR